MQVTAPSVRTSSPPDSQREALISLLGDEDPKVYQAVRAKILSLGDSARAWLRPHTLSSDPLVRRHSQDIIRHFDRSDADNQFLAFCLRKGHDLDLEVGTWMLARTQYPDINVEAYSAILDEMAEQIREHLPVTTTAHPRLSCLNHHLFEKLGFAGNEHNYYDPENSYLNRVLDRRTGNPINMCLVYMLIARRLQLPITGIGLPGHFLCRYQSTSDELYIDAFDRGKLMTKADCVQYLVRGNYDLRDEYLSPISSRRMLTRICGNLHQIYLRMGLEEETLKFQRYLVALAR